MNESISLPGMKRTRNQNSERNFIAKRIFNFKTGAILSSSLLLLVRYLVFLVIAIWSLRRWWTCILWERVTTNGPALKYLNSETLILDKSRAACNTNHDFVLQSRTSCSYYRLVVAQLLNRINIRDNMGAGRKYKNMLMRCRKYVFNINASHQMKYRVAAINLDAKQKRLQIK